MKIIIILILVLIVIYFYDILIREQENFLSYADEKDPYILPTVHKNVITDEEAKYILEKAESSFSKSEIVGGFDDSIRKSNTAWLSKSDDKIKNIIERICKMNNLPLENAEDLQVVKYEPKGYYRVHHDSCCDDNESCKKFVEDGGQRVVTMVIYLNDNFKGGETNFPNLNMKLKAPRCGGLLFFPLEDKGTRCHPYALHEGTDIEEGVKYIANVWIREKKFR